MFRMNESAALSSTHSRAAGLLQILATKCCQHATHSSTQFVYAVNSMRTALLNPSQNDIFIIHGYRSLLSTFTRLESEMCIVEFLLFAMPYYICTMALCTYLTLFIQCCKAKNHYPFDFLLLILSIHVSCLILTRYTFCIRYLLYVPFWPLANANVTNNFLKNYDDCVN